MKEDVMFWSISRLSDSHLMSTDIFIIDIGLVDSIIDESFPAFILFHASKFDTYLNQTKVYSIFNRLCKRYCVSYSNVPVWKTNA